jgi:hypothetical protein
MLVKPICWLVHGYFETDALAVLYGPPSKGKSFIALDIACCVATGTDFHDLKVQQGAVFYIAGEGHNGLARRLRAWEQLNGVSLEGVPLYISVGPTDLGSAVNAAGVAETVRALVNATGVTPVLIIIDTLARNFGGDENSATDIGQFVRNVDSHLRREWNATTLIIHHSGKNVERGARGSSALKGAADAEYEVSREDEDRLIRLTPRKMKDAEEPPPLAFELEVIQIEDNTGSMIRSAALRVTSYTPPNTSGLGKNQQMALDILECMHKEIVDRLASQGREDHPVHIETKDWRKRCEAEDMPRNRIKEVIDALVERNAIRLDGMHVYLMSEASEPIGESDIRTPRKVKSSGPIGRHSDAVRTETGHMISQPLSTVTIPAEFSGDI